MTRLAPPQVALRPQTVLLTFFGDYLSAPGTSVASAGVIALLAATGVGEHAARATLSRMVRRGLLHRTMVGRQAYFGLTEFGCATVNEGRERTHAADGVTGQTPWDGQWTFVAYSLPEEAQRERHELRAVLGWAGFGMLQAGLWVSPRQCDVVALVDDPGVVDHLHVFRGRPEPPSTDATLVRQAYDLSELAAAYSAFCRRWRRLARGELRRLDDPLVTRVLLTTDWLQVVRHDPRLPVQFHSRSWPGIPARSLYVDLDRRLARPAEKEAASRLDILTTPAA